MTVVGITSEVREVYLENAPPGLVGDLTIRVIDPPAGTIITEETAAGITEGPAGYYTKALTFPATLGQYSIVWRNPLTDPDTEIVEELRVVAVAGSIPGGAYPFASPADIEARLGRSLTEPEVIQAPLLLDLVSGLIVDAAGQDFAWAAALTTIPPAVRTICVEAVVRVLLNPAGARSQQEQLGQWAHSVSYMDGMGVVGLTERVELQIRRAFYGSNTAGPRAETLAETIIEEGLAPPRFGGLSTLGE